MGYLNVARSMLEEMREDKSKFTRDGSPDPMAKAVTAMKLDEFANAGLIVRVRSEILGADVLFVSDDVPASKLNGPEVVYRAQELKKLARVPPDPRCLRNLQMVKEILGGTIQDVRKKDSRAEPPSTSNAGESQNG